MIRQSAAKNLYEIKVQRLNRVLEDIVQSDMKVSE